MARKPNYKFERLERDRAKAAKKAARAKAKAEKVEARKGGSPEVALTDDSLVGAPPAETGLGTD